MFGHKIFMVLVTYCASITWCSFSFTDSGGEPMFYHPHLLQAGMCWHLFKILQICIAPVILVSLPIWNQQSSTQEELPLDMSNFFWIIWKAVSTETPNSWTRMKFYHYHILNFAMKFLLKASSD
jgi:hypothetical protein